MPALFNSVLWPAPFALAGIMSFFVSNQQATHIATETRHYIKTVATADNTYEVEIKGPDSAGLFTLSAHYAATNKSETLRTSPALDSQLFFIITPDGNYTSLGSGSFSTTWRPQTSSSATDFNLSNMQVYAMEKNDPDRPGRAAVHFRDNRGLKDTIITFKTDTMTLAAKEYPFSGTLLDAGVSWSPYDRWDAFYLLTISYTNPSPDANNIIDGSIYLDYELLDVSGFSASNYTAYKLKGGDDPESWEIEKSMPANKTFEFSGLRGGEVRHIYIRMDRLNPSSFAPANYQVILKAGKLVDTLYRDTEQLAIGPHDPNFLRVFPKTCPSGCTVPLTYVLLCQNEGNGAATGIRAWVKFSEDHILKTLKIIHSSNKVKLVKSSRCERTAEFRFARLYLPGFAQSTPPKPTFRQTIAWVSFSIDVRCPKIVDSKITNQACVVFYDTGNKPMPLDPTNVTKLVVSEPCNGN